ncbi:MAG: ATP-binding protein [Selenomonadaceae bacterium]|nr:ATP-binding protein [Selenomonadaceae bacterium]
MLNLNTLDKEDALAIIKELFAEMCSSRRQLKPILTEILRAIDNNLFIDADSDEVKDLLEQILQMQESLSQVDDLKKAVSTKRLSAIDDAINEIDRNRIVTELKSVLSKFKTLTCDSGDENEIDAAKKLKRQAHKLSVKADKISAERFAEEGAKFIDVADKIEDSSKLTSSSFMEIQESFPENRFLAYCIMKGSLRFDAIVDDIQPQTVTNLQPTVATQQNITQSDTTQHPTTDDHQDIDTILKLVDKYDLRPNALFIDEESITVDTKTLKKKLSVKSLTNKLHDFADGSESLAYPILRTFCKCRVFSVDPTFDSYQQDDKARHLIPAIVDKLYSWAIADKVHWQGIEFFYLNDRGRDLLTRSLSITHTADTFAKYDIPIRRLAAYLRRFILFSAAHALGLKNANTNISVNATCHWLRCSSKRSTLSTNTTFVFTLTLLANETWTETFAAFVHATHNEDITSGANAVIILLPVVISTEESVKWLQLLTEVAGDTPKVYALSIAEGGYRLTDAEGTEIDISEWSNILSFDEISDAEDIDTDTENVDENYDNTEIDNVPDVDDVLDNSSLEDTSDDTEDIKDAEETEYTKSIDITEVDEIDEIPKSAKDTGSIKDKHDTSSITDHLNDFEVADTLLDGDDNYSTRKCLQRATDHFLNGHAGRGMLLLHMLDFDPAFGGEDWASSLTLETGCILDDPLCSRRLSNVDPFDFWDTFFVIPYSESTDDIDYLKLAVMVKSFFAPPEPMSFQLKSRWNQLNDDKSNAALKDCPSAKKLIGLFKNFAEQTHTSFASCLNVDHSDVETQLKNAVDAVRAACERTDAISHMQLRHPRSQGLVKLLYEPKGKVRQLLDINNPYLTEDSIIEYCSQFTDEDIKRLDLQSATISEDIFSESKVGEYLDDIWSSIKVDSRRNERFTSVERPRQINVLKQALAAMLSYAFAKRHIEVIKNSGSHTAPTTKALEILKDIIRELVEASSDSHKKSIGYAVFSLCVRNITAQIKGENKPLYYRDCLLGTKYLELGVEGLPIFKSYDVPAFNFTNRILAYEKALDNLDPKEMVNSAYETAVRGCDLGILTLLEGNFRELLDRSDEELKRRRENVSKQVERQLDRIYHEFLDNLELDRNYDRITDQEEIEHYISIAAEAKEHFAETKNAGIYQRFISACRSEIVKTALPHKNAMEQRLKSLEDTLYADLGTDEELGEKYPVIAEIHRQLDLGNLTVAEDYLNRWNDLGGQLGSLEVVESRNDAFEDFLKEYEYIFNACLKNKSESLEKIHTRLRGGSAKNRTERDAADFVSAWQGLNTDYKAKTRAETSLVELLKHLSFGSAVVDRAEKIPPNQWNFHVAFPDYRRSKAAYPHPFAVFGTDTAVKGLSVTYLAGSRSADNITSALTSTTQPSATICIVDAALSLAERRRLAQAFKLRPDLRDIIVIDRVLAIYLTRFEDSVRGVKLLKTALPFANVQPYTTGGVVAPEMFIGRSKELAAIRDMLGPVFVYGGRQLGKSALLRQVRNIENDPAASCFAFFIELKGLDTERSLEKIVRELKETGLISENETVETWDDFASNIRNLMSGKAEEYKVIAGGKTPNKLLLLLDESDEFLTSAAEGESRAIDVLRELRETFSGKFKFVLAGLHKVIRFEKNSSFGNLDHISVLPFSPTDALELLLKPMSYLGFNIEDESLMSAIFSKANYYPGLIQYYCKMIVDAAGDNYVNRNFDVTKNPPYKLNDEYLKNMLGKRDFQDEINKKFQITLKLDDDNYYEIIALVIATAYYEQGRPVSVSASEIREVCYIYGIDRIAEMSGDELEGLLSEMVELNLLREVEGGYGFNRYAFWHMLGSESEVESRLSSYGSGQ